ncbi:MAG: nicotinate-nucleotide adenylyltransferase, partial [Oceanicoccus sp.]
MSMVNCKSSLKTVALFGGTFDPLHNGHLQSAVELKQRLGLDQFKLLPCHLPPHDKVPGCSSEQRLAMAELAVEGTGLEVDSWELQRDELSYSVDTLAHFRQLLGAEVSLSWVMGSEAFALFSRWHR